MHKPGIKKKNYKIQKPKKKKKKKKKKKNLPARFKDNTSAAYLAEMGSLSSKNKNVK